MGKSDQMRVLNMLSATNSKKDIFLKFNSWPQSKMMTGAKTMPIHCNLTFSFYKSTLCKNDDHSEESLTHKDWQLVPGLLEV